MCKPVLSLLFWTFLVLWISENLFHFCIFVTIPVKILMSSPTSLAFIEAVLYTLSSLCTIHQHSFFLFFKHLHGNKSAAHKWICSDVPSACEQHEAAQFLEEIKELGYMGKGVHWRQSSCSTVFWTFIYQLPLHNHGIMAAIFHSHQRLYFFSNCYQIFDIRPLACACAV